MSALGRQAVSTLALRARLSVLRVENMVDGLRREPSAVDLRRELRAIRRHADELLEAGETLAQQLEAAPAEREAVRRDAARAASEVAS